MGPDRWSEIERLYHAALEKQASERISFLDRVCAGDPALRQEVESLLAFADDSGTSIKQIVQEIASPVSSGGTIALPDRDAFPAARKLGRYELIQQIGKGGMGIVYRAIDPTINRTVAIKTILCDQDAGEQSGELRARLLRESQAGGRLSHPHIVTVYDVSEQDQTAYIVMEYVVGRTLAQAIADSPLRPAGEVLRIVDECANALDYAHSHEVVHRDIKPANIMLQADGSVKITDFGIAKVAQLAPLTQSAMTVGSPHYMAPEQWKGEGVTGLADQYALGAIAYAMLTGHRPFEGDSMAAMAAKTLFEEPPAVATLNPALNPAVNSVLRKVLAKTPASRYESCTQFARALRVACEKPQSKHVRVAAILAAALAIALAAGFWFYQRNSEAQTEVVYWTSIRESKSPDPFRAYLKRYPQGRFADLAKAQSEARKNERPPDPNPVLVAPKNPTTANVPRTTNKSQPDSPRPPAIPKQEPPSGTDPYLLGDALLRRGKYAESLEYFSKAIAIRPEYRAYFGRAGAYQRMERFDQAVEDYSQAIRLNPAAAMAYHERAVCLVRLRENDRAFADFNRAVELGPDNALAWNGRGAIYLSRKDYAKAIDDFNEAIRLRPTLAQAFRNRAAAKKALGDTTGASADLKRAEELK